MIQFDSDLQHVTGFHWVLRVLTTSKTDRHKTTRISC